MPKVSVIIPAAGAAQRPTLRAGFPRWWLLIVGVAAAVLAAARAVWVFMPGAVEGALKYAPPNAVGLVHVDVEMMAEDVFKELQKQEDELGEVSDADLGEIEKIISKIDSLDVFFLLPSGDKEPEFVVVFRTSLTPSDIMNLQREFGTESDALEKTGNGRYDAPESKDRMIFGAEADDLDEGIILFAPKGVLTDKFVAELGTGDNSKLRKMLVGVDTSTPAWAAVAMDFIDEADAPTMIVASLDPRGGGSGQLVITFKSEKYAERVLRDIADEDFSLSGVFDATRDGAVVTMKIKSEWSFVGRIFAEFLKARRSTTQPWEQSKQGAGRIEQYRRDGNIGALAKELGNADAETARRAVQALGHLGKKAVKHVEQAIGDARPQVREAAAVALGRLDDLNSAPLLAETVRSDKSANVRGAAASALGRMCAYEQVESLLDAMVDSNATVRRRAYAAYYRITGVGRDFQADDLQSCRRTAEYLRKLWPKIRPRVIQHHERKRKEANL